MATLQLKRYRGSNFRLAKFFYHGILFPNMICYVFFSEQKILTSFWQQALLANAALELSLAFKSLHKHIICRYPRALTFGKLDFQTTLWDGYTWVSRGVTNGDCASIRMAFSQSSQPVPHDFFTQLRVPSHGFISEGSQLLLL